MRGSGRIVLAKKLEDCILVLLVYVRPIFGSSVCGSKPTYGMLGIRRYGKVDEPLDGRKGGIQVVGDLGAFHGREAERALDPQMRNEFPKTGKTTLEI